MIATRESAATRRARYARFDSTDEFANPELAPATSRTKRAVVLLALTLFIPGGAQVLVGNKTLGRVGLRIWLGFWAVMILIGLIAVINRGWLLYLAANNITQFLVVIIAVILGLIWAILWLDTFRLIRLHLLAPGMRPVIAVALIVLMILTSGTMFYAAWAVNSSRTALGNIFSSGPPIEPSHGRYNFLIMGADAGEGRQGLRPDSIHLASINAKTGKTMLISVPRNFQNAQFREDSPLRDVYPEGFNCGDECIINALYTDVMNNHQDLYPDAEDPGAEAMMDAVSGTTGLDVQGYVMLDMDGFSELIDAMGGVEVTSGGWTVHRGERPDGQWGDIWWEPGTYTFNGDDALAFARSRHYSSDYSRIRRQQCIQQAMISQFDLPTLLTRFQEILGAGEQIVETDLPSNQLDTFLSLGNKAKSQPMQRLTLGAPDFGDQGDRFSTYPDFDEIHQRIADMLDEDGTPLAVTVAPLLMAHTDVENDGVTGAEKTEGATSQDPDDWPEPPTEVQGYTIDEDFLMWAGDTGQDALLEEVSSTNHLCHPGS